MAKGYNRHFKNYLIDKRLQLRHVAVVCLLSATLSALLGWLIWQQRGLASTAITRNLATSDYIDAAVKRDILDHLQGSDLEVLLMMAAFCLGLILVLSFFVVFLTHKVAGPLHHVGASIDALNEGRLPRVHAPRKGDELKHFFRKFKGMADTLRDRATADAVVYDEALARLPRTGALGEALDAVAKRREEIRKSLE